MEKDYNYPKLKKINFLDEEGKLKLDKFLSDKFKENNYFKSSKTELNEFVNTLNGNKGIDTLCDILRFLLDEYRLDFMSEGASDEMYFFYSNEIYAYLDYEKYIYSLREKEITSKELKKINELKGKFHYDLFYKKNGTQRFYM